MRKFEEILELAASRHGKAEIDAVLKASVPVKESGARSLSRYSPPLTEEALAAIPDDRWLSAATKAVFCAGFNWKVVENKWEGFEEAFEGFDLGRWVMSDDDDLAALLADKRVIRNGQKLASVPRNARFFAGLSRENRGVGRYVAGWPVTNQTGLMSALERGGDRLGGNT
nr:DNA-3-methyladenine glycosylase I [Nitratireductor sp.]